MEILKKTNKKIISVLLSIAIIGSIISPAVALAGSEAQAAGNAATSIGGSATNLYHKFVSMIGFGKKVVPVEPDTASKAKVVAEKASSIAAVIAKGAFNGTKAVVTFTAKTAYGAVSSVTGSAFGATKFVAKSFVESFIGQLGRLAAYGAIATFGVATLAVAYRLKVGNFPFCGGKPKKPGDGNNGQNGAGAQANVQENAPVDASASLDDAVAKGVVGYLWSKTKNFCGYVKDKGATFIGNIFGNNSDSAQASVQEKTQEKVQGQTEAEKKTETEKKLENKA